MELKGLTEVGNKTNRRVSDSVISRRKRILDAKRRMAARRSMQEDDETASASVNRISDSTRPSRQLMRGVASRRAAAAQGMARKQDSRAKSYFALRKRIKDELSETDTTEDAIETAVNIMQEEVDSSPQDVLAAVVEVLGDVIETLPEPAAEDAGSDEDFSDEDFEDDAEEEVSDSVRRRSIVRRPVSDARKRAIMRKRVMDALARKRAAIRRIRDARMARRRAAARVRDSRAAVGRRLVRRSIADNKRMVRRG